MFKINKRILLDKSYVKKISVLKIVRISQLYFIE